MDLSDYLKKRKTYLENKIVRLEKDISEAPSDRLICTKSNGYDRWYISSETSAKASRYTYLGKKDYALIRTLILRSIHEAQTADLKRELEEVNHYLAVLHPAASSYHRLIAEHPQYLPFLNATTPPMSKKIEEWLAEEYPYNPERKEYTVKAQNGLMVRSKSEALIIQILLEYNIPFRYECPVYVYENTYYPDFTIMHPRTGQIFLWEHFGLMERDHYAAKNAKRVADYRKLGYFPFKNLIMTFEYSDTAFDVTIIEEMINRFLT